jgi:hypothetical protein
MDIYQKQFREVVDNDLNINRQVLNRQIKQVTLSPEGYKERLPVDSRVRYNIARLFNLFRIAIETEIDIYNQGEVNDNYAPVLEAYNNLVAYVTAFSNKNEISSKDYDDIKDRFMKLMPYIEALYEISEKGNSVDKIDVKQLYDKMKSQDYTPIGVTQIGLDSRLGQKKTRDETEQGEDDIYQQLSSLAGTTGDEEEQQKYYDIYDKFEELVKRLKEAEGKNDFLNASRYSNELQGIEEEVQDLYIEKFGEEYKREEKPKPQPVQRENAVRPTPEQLKFNTNLQFRNPPKKGTSTRLDRFNAIRRGQTKAQQVDIFAPKEGEMTRLERIRRGLLPEQQVDLFADINPFAPKTGQGRRRKMKGGVGGNNENIFSSIIPKRNMERRNMKGGFGGNNQNIYSSIIPKRNVELGLPPNYHETLKESSILNRNASQRSIEDTHFKRIARDLGENVGRVDINRALTRREDNIVSGQGRKRNALNHNSEKNELFATKYNY